MRLEIVLVNFKALLDRFKVEWYERFIPLIKTKYFKYSYNFVLKQTNGLNNVDNKKAKDSNKDAIQRRHAFMLTAKRIGKELTNTCVKLEKLTDCKLIFKIKMNQFY